MAGGPTPLQRQRAQAREQRAVELRLLGHTYEQIAHAMLCTNPEHRPDPDPSCGRCVPLYRDKSAARKAVVRALGRDYALGAEGREQLRQTHLARLDLLYRRAARAAVQGEWEAARVAVRILDAQAKVLGIYAPSRLQITTEIDQEIEAMLDEMGVADAPELRDQVQP